MWGFCSSSKNILANNFFSSHHLSALKCIKNLVRNSYLFNPWSQKVLKANLHVVSKKNWFPYLRSRTDWIVLYKFVCLVLSIFCNKGGTVNTNITKDFLNKFQVNCVTLTVSSMTQIFRHTSAYKFVAILNLLSNTTGRLGLVRILVTNGENRYHCIIIYSCIHLPNFPFHYSFPIVSFIFNGNAGKRIMKWKIK